MSATATPRRIQRRRTKGSRMPKGAVYVGRPSRWGNPFRAACHMRYDRSTYWSVVIDLGCMHRHPTGQEHPRQQDAVAEAVDLFAAWLHGEDWRTEYVRRCPQQALHVEPLLTPPTFEAIRAALGGRDLACWCDLDCACHADVLLEIAKARGEETA